MHSPIEIRGKNGSADSATRTLVVQILDLSVPGKFNVVLTTTMCNECYDKYNVRLKSSGICTKLGAELAIQKILPLLKGFAWSKLSLLAGWGFKDSQ